MKRLVLVLLAACGGGSTATQTTTTPTTTPSGEEDWRGYLGQLAGTPCRWVPGASFLVCKVDGPATFLGWEMTNRRYVAWRIDADGIVSVLPGNASNAGWTFEGPDGRIDITRVDATTWNATGLGASTSHTLTVDPAANPGTVTPSSAPATEDWRSALQPLVGEWAFSGTAFGGQTSYVQTCDWIPTSTFVVCRNGGDGTWALTGWEPHNRRYVQITVDDKGVPQVAPGTVASKNWSFKGETQTTLTRKSALEYEVRVVGPGGAVFLEGVYTTKPGAE